MVSTGSSGRVPATTPTNTRTGTQASGLTGPDESTVGPRPGSGPEATTEPAPEPVVRAVGDTTTGPPRAVRMPREERRAQLLDAATDVFTAKGYYAAAMDDIADAAGVSKPVLYQHFGSKLELYLDLVDASCQRLTDLLENALTSTSDNAERVRATTRAFYDFVAESSGEFRFVFESELTAEPAVQKRIWRLNNDIADAIAPMIAEDTGLAAAEAKLLAISLVGGAQVSARYWVSEGRGIDATQAEHLVANLQWRGIGGFPRSEPAG